MYEKSFEALEGFFKNYKKIAYAKGETIFKPGDVMSSVYFIKEGYVRLFSVDSEGKEITFNTFKPIFLLSYFYAKFRKENRFFFEAVTKTEIYEAPRNGFFKFLKENPEIENDVTEMYMQKVEELLIDYENVLAGKAHEKVANIILSLAKTYGKKTDKGLVVDFNLTHEIIASLSGVTRETASIQIEKLEKEHIFTKIGRNLIIN